MNFPDLHHLQQLQKDIWQQPDSRASLMVGAGLSLNAERLPGRTTSFPTWSKLVEKMFDELYPLQASPAQVQEAERNKKLMGVGPLRIASEYEAAFGRQKLDTLIRNENPDSDYVPGSLHQILLKLPWKDVFTTNYDTLLERTKVLGRNYQPVIKPHDLTHATSPRIVKLHGSFPSESPFIISEDDYRTYPKKYAPFVNTVQQSLVENTFVLIGFSGDDPNFLQWTGWIRDELGNQHAPIYLVGLLRLGAAERKLMEQRGVTPIDLSPIIKIHYKNEHAVALEWFLRCLEQAKPAKSELWPNDVPIENQEPSDLPPLIGLKTLRPQPIQFQPSYHSTLTKEQILEILQNWIHQRQEYPGWVVAPVDSRSDIARKNDNWNIHILKACKDWDHESKVLIHSEANWRMEVAMSPLTPTQIEHFEPTIEDLYPKLVAYYNGSRPALSSKELDISTNSLVNSWIEVTFGLLREAREMFDSERWDSFHSKLSSIVKYEKKHEDRFNYEVILWHLWNARRPKALELCLNWTPSPNNISASIWKAGTLIELDEIDTASSIMRDGLTQIREGLHRDGHNLMLLSLEGWTTYLLNLSDRLLRMSRGTKPDASYRERWQELRRWDCDPWTHNSYFRNKLAQPIRIREAGKETWYGFDPGDRKATFHFQGTHSLEILPAFAYIRLFEQVGIPLKAKNMDMGGEALINAAKTISSYIGHWDFAILARAGKLNRDDKYEIMPRTRVGMLSKEHAERIYKWSYSALKNELVELSSDIPASSHLENLIKVLTEILSRLAFRLSETELDESLQLALQMHSSRWIKTNAHLHDATAPWFERLFESATSDQLTNWLQKLLNEDIYNEGPLSHHEEHRVSPDPLRSFPYHKVDKAIDNISDNTSNLIDRLLKFASSAEGDARERAITRLFGAYGAGILTTSQSDFFGDILWSEVDTDGIPRVKSLWLCSYLNLPSPPNIDVENLIKKKILGLTPRKDVTVQQNGKVSTSLARNDIAIEEIIGASKPIVELGANREKLIDWSEDEAAEILRKVLDWWDNEKRGISKGEDSSHVFGSVNDKIKRIGPLLQDAVLPRLDASKPDWERIWEAISVANQHEIYLTECFPYLLIHKPEKLGFVSKGIKEHLLSNSEEAVASAAKAVRHWIALHSNNIITHYDDTVLDILINNVIFRKKSGIHQCLIQLSELIHEQPKYFAQNQIETVIYSLEEWNHATKFKNQQENDDQFKEGEKPSLRANVAILASSLDLWVKNELGKGSSYREIEHWRASCRSDTLPEIREAFDFFKKYRS